MGHWGSNDVWGIRHGERGVTEGYTASLWSGSTGAGEDKMEADENRTALMGVGATAPWGRRKGPVVACRVFDSGSGGLRCVFGTHKKKTMIGVYYQVTSDAGSFQIIRGVPRTYPSMSGSTALLVLGQNQTWGLRLHGLLP